MHHGHMRRGKRWAFNCALTAAVTTLCNFPTICPGTLPWWLRVDWLSCKTLSKGVCSIAGSLLIMQSVPWCCLIAAWGPVPKSFLDPIAGLWELVNIRVWLPITMLEERGGHGGVMQVEWKKLSENFLVWPQKSCSLRKWKFCSGVEKLWVTANFSKSEIIVNFFVFDRSLTHNFKRWKPGLNGYTVRLMHDGDPDKLNGWKHISPTSASSLRCLFITRALLPQKPCNLAPCVIFCGDLGVISWVCALADEAGGHDRHLPSLSGLGPWKAGLHVMYKLGRCQPWPYFPRRFWKHTQFGPLCPPNYWHCLAFSRRCVQNSSFSYNYPSSNHLRSSSIQIDAFSWSCRSCVQALWQRGHLKSDEHPYGPPRYAGDLFASLQGMCAIKKSGCDWDARIQWNLQHRASLHFFFVQG